MPEFVKEITEELEYEPSRSDILVTTTFFLLLAYTGLFRYMPFGSSIADERLATVSSLQKYTSAACGVPLVLSLCIHPYLADALRSNIPLLLYSLSILMTIPLRANPVSEFERSLPLAIALLGGALTGGVLGRTKATALWALKSLSLLCMVLFFTNAICALRWSGAGVPLGWARALDGRGFLWMETAVIVPTCIGLSYIFCTSSQSLVKGCVFLFGVYIAVYTSARTYVLLDVLMLFLIFRSFWAYVGIGAAIMAVSIVFAPQVIEAIDQARVVMPEDMSEKSWDFFTTGRLGIFQVQYEMFNESPFYGVGQARVKEEITDRYETGELKGRSEYGLILHFASYGLLASFWLYYCVREGAWRPVLMLMSPQGADPFVRSVTGMSIITFIASLIWVFSQGTSGATWYGTFLWGLQAMLFDQGVEATKNVELRPRSEIIGVRGQVVS